MAAPGETRAAFPENRTLVFRSFTPLLPIKNFLFFVLPSRLHTHTEIYLFGVSKKHEQFHNATINLLYDRRLSEKVLECCCKINFLFLPTAPKILI